MKILVINGPNLDMIGQRDEVHYGSITLSDIEMLLTNSFPEIEIHFFQSNLEGEIVSKIYEANNNYSGILINPGGYAHTSVAIHDALEICNIPKIEIHLSNISAREEFRQVSITARKCNGYIAGLREIGYLAGIYSLKLLIK